MGHWSHVRVVTAGAKSDEIIATIRVGPGLVSWAASGAIRIILAEASCPEVHYIKMDEHCNDPIMSAVWPESDAAVKTKHSIIPN